MQTLTIKGELTDLNTFIKATNAHYIVGNRAKRKDTELVRDLARADLKPVTKYPVKIQYDWHSPNAKKDIDNISFAKKFINDGLVEAGILENDSRKFLAGFSDNFYIDRENPRVEVTIESVS